MVIRKSKKITKQRGSKTHGYGAMKKHRGAGHRGGVGNAGSGKRGDAKKPTLWKEGRKLGKSGFKKHGLKKEIVSIDFLMISREIVGWEKAKKITIENDIYMIDLNSLGYNKLLGRGSVSGKFNITVKSASKKAIEKIGASGGQVKVE